MRKSTGVKLAAAAALTAMLGSTISSPLAEADDRSPAPAKTVAASGIPALVDPAADLGAKTPGPQDDWADSIYFTSRVNSGGHDIGLLVHTVRIPKGPGNLLLFSVHDATTGWYKSHATRVDAGEYAWSTTGLDITAPGFRWTGNAQRMSVSLDVPWGSLDVVLQARGPAFNYGGTGAFSLFGQTNYEFALPELRTTGTLTLDGRPRQLTGQSWLDRQWGPTDGAPGNHWSWMNLNMPNGDAVAIWDAVRADGETHTWATVLRKDGSYEVASVVPLADDAGEYWTSPATGQRYPTRWTVSIPALKTRLAVQITGNPGQEIVLGGNGRLEATAAFEGAYHGAKVTGKNFVEMFGDWQS
jgi:predicted secreted hydrolase